jgi:hypothetical protein
MALSPFFFCRFCLRRAAARLTAQVGADTYKVLDFAAPRFHNGYSVNEWESVRSADC